MEEQTALGEQAASKLLEQEDTYNIRLRVLNITQSDVVCILLL